MLYFLFPITEILLVTGGFTKDCVSYGPPLKLKAFLLISRSGFALAQLGKKKKKNRYRTLDTVDRDIDFYCAQKPMTQGDILKN